MYPPIPLNINQPCRRPLGASLATVREALIHALALETNPVDLPGDALDDALLEDRIGVVGEVALRQPGHGRGPRRAAQRVAALVAHLPRRRRHAAPRRPVQLVHQLRAQLVAGVVGCAARRLRARRAPRARVQAKRARGRGRRVGVGGGVGAEELERVAARDGLFGEGHVLRGRA